MRGGLRDAVIRIRQQRAQLRHRLAVPAHAHRDRDAGGLRTMEAGKRLAERGIDGGIRNRLQRKSRHVTQLRVAEQGRERGHRRRGADAGQFPARVHPFLDRCGGRDHRQQLRFRRAGGVPRGGPGEGGRDE